LVFRGIALVAILSFVSLSAFADTIRLKDGSIIKGKIVSFAGGTFSVDIGDGSRKRHMTFSSDEVASIQFDSQAFQTTARYEPPVVRNDNIIKVSTGNPSSTSANPRVVTTDTTTSAKVPAPEPPKVATPAATVSSQPKSTIPAATTTTPSQQKVSIPIPSSDASQPVELNVKVLADNTANGWTNSGWVVKRGQRIRISGEGQISLGGGKTTTAAGLPDLSDDQKLLRAVPTGALIAVIGDDNNDFIYVGAQREFTASRDGTLFLGVNEGNLNDNSGSFAVKIQILPGER
jgi:hypothetical protein